MGGEGRGMEREERGKEERGRGREREGRERGLCSSNISLKKPLA